ncbi:glycosyltransferase family 2 protein [Asticcacaulis machinosus]|uniref:Glycosyltransferase family 2 protein n=1 Tax=Asticcacaulis machinosus TaxID=2984211 RepID=A0ABT5HEN6_9CAUL|nr:glycosyltransferase family 2 protein [Asticcacaulis machinosus]MDC7674720.1 glycosyltransferase family 2 protein [Asticcacaulis machinosus]
MPKPITVSDPFLEASNENLPRYSVIVALYREALIVPQLVGALSNLVYPRENLEILYALEADDEETIAAFKAQNLPDYMHLVIVPPGTPRTKPRALNYTLKQATGELVVIYDAEDRPAPDQLLEAARTFDRARKTGDASLACLQAPLRPKGGDGFIARQFAAEYAVQFDVLLPAFCRLKLPFPLGGTSNHFRTKVLKSIGAWDSYNVTEDADLGLRLAQYGYTSAMLKAPTIETPPSNIYTWIPQRTRWIKGYMQTLLVHSRLTTTLRLKVWASMILGVGLSTLAALCYAPFTCMVISSLMLQALSGQFSPIAYRDLGLLLFGTLSGMLALYQGAQRTGVPFGLKDVLSAPFYWSLQSISAAHAIYQLIVKPFHWDKTDHKPAAIS